MFFSAERVITNEQLEEMLESGNPAIFVSGVSELAESIRNRA